MLDIFSNNWDDLPELNDGERLIRIITGNWVESLYAIVTDDMDLEYEIRTALRFKHGRSYTYEGYEDATYLYRGGSLFQQYELDDLLGEFADDYDVDGIVEDATEMDYKTGNRYWVVNDDELNAIIEAHEK